MSGESYRIQSHLTTAVPSHGPTQIGSLMETTIRTRCNILWIYIAVYPALWLAGCASDPSGSTNATGSAGASTNNRGTSAAAGSVAVTAGGIANSNTVAAVSTGGIATATAVSTGGIANGATATAVSTGGIAVGATATATSTGGIAVGAGGGSVTSGGKANSATGAGGTPASAGAKANGTAGTLTTTGGRANSATGAGGTPANAGTKATNTAGTNANAGAPNPNGTLCSTFSSSPTVTGTLFAGATGISGIVASRKQPSVFWIHSDRQKILYAIDQTGVLLGKWTLTNSDRFFFVYNWEDIGIQSVTGGPDRIWVGDIGNNFVRGGGEPRESVRLMSIDEPSVDPSNVVDAVAPVIGDYAMTYPDGLHDAEAMSVDPLTGDVYVFTKEEQSPSKIFRARAPVQSGAFEYLGTLDASNLNAADFSASGKELLVRDYTQAYYWTRPAEKSWSETLLGAPNKTIRLKWTTGYYSEAVGFAADDSGFYAVSEEEDGAAPSPVEFYPRTCK